jgi:hypothetical protein
MKPPEILMRLTAQSIDEMLSRTQVYDWSKSFKEGWTEAKTAPSAWKVMATDFWDSQGVLFIDFLTHQ